ncbi:hypothetical protein MKW92_014526, partial [Papaver armeniacum]
MKSSPAGSSVRVNHSVNIRKRMDPPSKDASFGNLSVSVTSVLPAATTAMANKTVD